MLMPAGMNFIYLEQNGILAVIKQSSHLRKEPTINSSMQ